MAGIRIEMISGRVREYHALDRMAVERAYDLLQGAEGHVFVDFTTSEGPIELSLERSEVRDVRVRL
ncbi:hypothetical protein [Deinococcus hopiensis]|uniref:Uncharacterized protein n=1 Tax=Deinococcus hopiensis KR-140 TaxID=695939 RepID=A0A1W1VV58_9DEIO|nr:hypothetical protein [Deinococcus hopiensis]SMB97272.1 hypothetical protein SAMN00790413_06462 [Deinococcus hopiensis KR-140]